MSRVTSVTVSSQAVSDWVPLDTRRIDFNVALGGIISSGANLTWKVQHTFDDLQKIQPVTLSRVTTTATLKLANHGLSVNDSVIIWGAAAPFSGTFAVASVVDANNITYTVANSGATAAAGFAVVLRCFDHITLSGQTTNADGNYVSPVTAVRLNVTAYTGGSVTLNIVQAGVI